MEAERVNAIFVGIGEVLGEIPSEAMDAYEQAVAKLEPATPEETTMREAIQHFIALYRSLEKALV